MVSTRFSTRDSGPPRPIWDKECLELHVWSKGKSNGLRRYLGYLENFRSTKDCAFLGLEEPYSISRDYHLFGWFLMPLRFLGHGPNVKIDFTGLTESLRRILFFLRKAPHGHRESGDAAA